jgi:hypothetical protein
MASAGRLALVLGFASLCTARWSIASLVAFGLQATISVFLAGAWMATTPDPSGIDKLRCGRLSRLARGLLLVGLLAPPLAELRVHIPLPQGLIRSTTAVLLACGFAGILAAVRYLQRLTLRIPDGRLFATLESYFRFLLITLSATTLAVWVLNLLEHPPAWLPSALLCAMLSPFFFMIVAVLRFTSLCSDLATSLIDQAKAARRLWPATEEDEAI